MTTYFRVPTEFQLRYRMVPESEIEEVRHFVLRPSPTSSLRNTLDTQLRGMRIDEKFKDLIEKGFHMLLNIDQRLFRLEEDLRSSFAGAVSNPYSFVRGEIGDKGLVILNPPSNWKPGQKIFLDMLLPSLPEQRILALGNLEETSNQKVEISFLNIHEEDRESIFRFVRFREREILRTRSAQPGS